VQFAVVFPFVEPHVAVELAQEAEASRWDGVFVWDTIGMFDPWVTLAAIAAHTERLRLGPIVTPVSRRRPWKLACETATLDQLSNGRLILPVGLGAAEDDRWARFGEATEPKTRAERLDEGLAVLDGLWSGQPFSFRGKHYRLDDVKIGVRPVQVPRVPIWVVGRWPDPPKTMLRRMLKWDGVLGGGRHARQLRDFLAAQRTEPQSFDIVSAGECPGDDLEKAATFIQPHAEVGVTWWLEDLWRTPWETGKVEGMRRRIQQGPPRQR
jgi:alkanesulfonate monooxygenase SsuD/methylene tetrahydromethanopterin reductase-like flavin-dependent oxidoreductase (luciferase family)